MVRTAAKSGAIRGGSATTTHYSVICRDAIETHDTHSDELIKPGQVRPKGLLNVGNTCYANAALQCLLSTALPTALLDPKSAAVFRRYSSNPNILAMGSGSVDSEDPEDTESEQERRLSKRERRKREREDRRMYKTCQWLTKELKLITKDWVDHHQPPPPPSSHSMRVFEWLSPPDRTRNIVNPGSITRHPDQLSNCLRPYCQEDAHEFLRALLGTLVMNGHNRQLSCLFDGLLESAVTCQTCRRPSLTRDRYMDLSLDIHGDHITSLVDALEEFTKTEILTGENKVFCQKCKSKRTASKGLRLATAPSILVTHLKRFAFDDYGNLVRLHKKVRFPLRLEIGDYMSKVNKSKPPPYELVGVLVHQGRTCDSGHYLAYTKCQGQWFKCNDGEVTMVDVKTVLKQQAYILMYEVENMQRKHGIKRKVTKPLGKPGSPEERRRSRSTPRSNSSSRKHSSKQSSFLSLLCGVDVLEESSFFNDLCFQADISGEASVSPAGTGHQDSVGVELVAQLRDDDVTISSTVCDASTVESMGSNKSNHQHKNNNDKPRGFRKSASSSNLQALEDEASTCYMNDGTDHHQPSGLASRGRPRQCPHSNSDDECTNSRRTFKSSKSDPGANELSPKDYSKLCEGKWSKERISRHNWKYRRDLPPLNDGGEHRHRRASSQAPPSSPMYK